MNEFGSEPTKRAISSRQLAVGLPTCRRRRGRGKMLRAASARETRDLNEGRYMEGLPVVAACECRVGGERDVAGN
jgi:hypothetical protein